jgi:hypothetical protein
VNEQRCLQLELQESQWNFTAQSMIIKLCWTLEACQQIIYKVLDESHYTTVVKHDFAKLLAAGFIRLVEQA